MNNQLKKGVLDLVILGMIANEDMYGYLIVQKLDEFLKVKESSIYIILTRLSQNNYLEAYDGYNGARKVKIYKITSAGEVYLKELYQHWDEINLLVDSVRKDDNE